MTRQLPIIIAFLLATPALAQPPAPEASADAQPAAEAGAPAGPVCLTNACGGAAVDLTGRIRARTVAEAIALGNGQAVKDLGGTPAQAMEALYRRAQARLEATPADQRAGA